MARLGAYLRIVTEGELRAGDAIHVVARPPHGVTLARVGESLRDPRAARDALGAPALATQWRDMLLGRDRG